MYTDKAIERYNKYLYKYKNKKSLEEEPEVEGLSLGKKLIIKSNMKGLQFFGNRVEDANIFIDSPSNPKIMINRFLRRVMPPHIGVLGADLM